MESEKSCSICVSYIGVLRCDGENCKKYYCLECREKYGVFKNASFYCKSCSDGARQSLWLCSCCGKHFSTNECASKNCLRIVCKICSFERKSSVDGKVYCDFHRKIKKSGPVQCFEKARCFLCGGGIAEHEISYKHLEGNLCIECHKIVSVSQSKSGAPPKEETRAPPKEEPEEKREEIIAKKCEDCGKEIKGTPSGSSRCIPCMGQRKRSFPHFVYKLRSGKNRDFIGALFSLDMVAQPYDLDSTKLWACMQEDIISEEKQRKLIESLLDGKTPVIYDWEVVVCDVCNDQIFPNENLRVTTCSTIVCGKRVCRSCTHFGENKCLECRKTGKKSSGCLNCGAERNILIRCVEPSCLNLLCLYCEKSGGFCKRCLKSVPKKENIGEKVANNEKCLSIN